MTLSLFTKGKADWKHQPLIAFDAWLVDAGMNPNSCTVYRAMWARYLSWAQERRLDITEMSKENLEAFLDSMRIRRQQRERYHRLIERVMDDMHSREAGAGNAARMAKTLRGMGWRNTEGNDPTGFLGESLRSIIVAHGESQSAPAADELVAGVANRAWRRGRARAMIGVFLGAGLKVSEARDLTLGSVNFAQAPRLWVRSPRQPMREACVCPYAARWLRDWLTIREATQTAGDWLFPGDIKGTQISVATISRLVRQFVSRATGDPALARSITAQTLRNDHVAQLLDEPLSHAEIAERMGFVDLISVARLEQAWEAWREERA